MIKTGTIKVENIKNKKILMTAIIIKTVIITITIMMMMMMMTINVVTVGQGM